MTIADELANLAKAIALSAQKEDVPLKDKVDALKALTPYYAATVKRVKGVDAEGDTFADLKRRANGIEIEEPSELPEQ
jgi:hypothetical protein